VVPPPPSLGRTRTSRQPRATKASVNSVRDIRPSGAVAGAEGKLCPYVEGTDLRVRLDVADGARFLVVRWAPGKKPFEVGRFSEKR
jgi:hypothetical protein